MIKTEKISNKNNEIKRLFEVKFELLKVSFLKSGTSYDKTLKFNHNCTDFIDEIILKIANSSTAIIALGGYGRRELAPYSDIDIVFVQEQAFTPQTQKLIETLTARFWEIGIKLSASTRTIAECEVGMKEDVLFLTSLLEMRLVCGPAAVYKNLEKAFQRHIAASPPGFFVSAKLEERDARHRKMGDTRYQLEPNIKEGKGALRDIQTLIWIANFLYGVRKPEELVKKNILTAAEAATLKKALTFFWTVRCHLHFMSDRANDRLSFDTQPHVAELMGYKDSEPNIRAEKFMKDYFLLAKEVGHLTRILCAKVEEQSVSGGATAGAKKMVFTDIIDGFPVKNGRLTVDGANHFKMFPPDIMRIFRAGQTSALDIHPDALRHIRNVIRKHAAELQKSAEAHRIFLDILLDAKHAERTLRLMNEADVLAALVPAFGNIVAHMQYDMYHTFTADEHTIRAIGLLHKLESGALAKEAPLATHLFSQIRSRRTLYVAMFLHDIAKGSGEKKRHSEKGATLAKTICPHMGLTPQETETVSWLVRQHLSMTLTAFKRDLGDPQTIADFTALVQSPERLKLLAIMTAADIMAVGPERWNNWKAGLLTELYERTNDMIRGNKNPQHTLPPLPPGKVQDGGTSIQVTPQPDHDHTEVIITTPDRKGLFSLLAGAMAAGGASIVSAQIFTLANGMAQDVFHIQDMKGHVYENTAFLQKTIRAVLDDKIDLADEIRQRQKNAPKKSAAFRVAPRVIIDNNASASTTMIEVNGKDRPGFLYDITSALSQLGLQISAAKVTTFGSRAVDVFYVRDSFGLKILHPDKLEAVENGLKQVLEKQ